MLNPRTANGRNGFVWTPKKKRSSPRREYCPRISPTCFRGGIRWPWPKSPIARVLIKLKTRRFYFFVCRFIFSRRRWRRIKRVRDSYNRQTALHERRMTPTHSSVDSRRTTRAILITYVRAWAFTLCNYINTRRVYSRQCACGWTYVILARVFTV